MVESLASDITKNLHELEKTISSLTCAHSVQLMAVSKTKPASAIVAAYEAGQRIFGENYVDEFVEKASSLEHLADIRWHFIGHVQTNKVRRLARILTLDTVETIDSIKLASTF